MGDDCFLHASVGVSCLMSAAAVSLALHQLLCARRVWFDFCFTALRTFSVISGAVS